MAAGRWRDDHLNGSLYPENFDPQADNDGDGWSNAQEAAAGTDPASANPPDGFLSPAIIHNRLVMPDPEHPESGPIEMDLVQVSWPTLIGKRYILFASDDMSSQSWLQVGESFTGDGSEMTYHFTREDSPKFFYRVAVDDIDTDGDGFTDHEEYQSGGDPLVADRDGDGLSDAWEIANNLNPDDDGSIDPDNGADGDPDGDGVKNAEEYLAGTAPGDGEDYPVQVIQIGRTASGQSNLIPYQHENQPPYNGTSSWGAEWEQEPYQEALIEDSPVTVDYLDGLQASVAFPPTPPDPDWGRSTLNPSSQISSRSRLTLPVGAATISGFVTSTRVWLKAPKQATEQSFHFVRVKRSSIHNFPANTNTEEYHSTTPVQIVIPANQDISLPIDLKNTPGTVADSDGHWYDELREITVSWRVWGDFDNLEDHIDPWTGRRKGQRIFPGFRNPNESTLRAKVRVVVSSSPSLVGQTVYVKSFDVDDSTDEAFDVGEGGSLPVIDTNGKAGNDNLSDYQGGHKRASSGTTPRLFGVGIPRVRLLT